MKEPRLIRQSRDAYFETKKRKWYQFGKPKFYLHKVRFKDCATPIKVDVEYKN